MNKISDGPIASMKGRALITVIGLVAMLLGLTEQEQGTIMGMVDNFIDQSGVYVAAVLAFYSKVKDTINNREGRRILK